MLTENPAEKTFPLECCIRRRVAQSAGSLGDCFCLISSSQILRLRLPRLRADNPKTKVCNFEQKSFPGFF